MVQCCIFRMTLSFPEVFSFPLLHEIKYIAGDIVKGTLSVLTQSSSIRTLLCVLKPAPIVASYRRSGGPFRFTGGSRDGSSFRFPLCIFHTVLLSTNFISFRVAPLCGLRLWLICFCRVFQMNPELEKSGDGSLSSTASAGLSGRARGWGWPRELEADAGGAAHWWLVARGFGYAWL